MKSVAIVLLLAGCGGVAEKHELDDGGARDGAPSCACAVSAPMPCVCGFNPSKASQQERAYCACVVEAVCSGKTTVDCYSDAKR